MKKLLILIVIALSMQACVKDKSDYYINQPRDPDVVGVWRNEWSAGLSYLKFTADGKMYSVSQYFDNDEISDDIDWGRSYKYWYSKDGCIYTYRYQGILYAEMQTTYIYRLSEDKKQMWIGDSNAQQQPQYERVENLE